MQIKDITIGSNMEIAAISSVTGKTGNSYPVKVQNINGNKEIEVDVPFSSGQMVLFHKDTTIEVVLTSLEGIFSFKAKVLERSKRNEIPILVVKPITEFEKKQRRAYFRLNYRCTVRYRKYLIPALGENEELYKTTQSVDISGGGIGIFLEEKISTEDFIDCVIILEKDVEINSVCKIVSIKKDDDNDKYWKAGLKFERISEQAREKIINSIFQEQVKLRRKGLV